MNPFLRYLADKKQCAQTHADDHKTSQDLAAYGAQVIISQLQEITQFYFSQRYKIVQCVEDWEYVGGSDGEVNINKPLLSIIHS